MRSSHIAALASVLCCAVNAQEPAAIATVRSASGFHTAAEAQFETYESHLATRCGKVAANWPAASHRVYGQPQTGTDGNLLNATWVEMVPGTACGQSRTYRVLVMIRGGKASVVSLLPGDGYAGPQLQHDALLPLAGAIGTVTPNAQKCPVDVINTHLTGTEPTAPKQPWSELWTVQTCGKRLNVPMQFIPDAAGPGTSIHIESKAIITLPQ